MRQASQGGYRAPKARAPLLKQQQQQSALSAWFLACSAKQLYVFQHATL